MLRPFFVPRWTHYQSGILTGLVSGCLGVLVIEYRRGVTKRIWGKLWHFHEQCVSYPTQTFAIRKDRPDDDELCAKCVGLAHGR